MERLTGWDGDRAYVCNLPPFEIEVVAHDLIRAAVERLAAYEDTGLEPEEVAYFLGTTMSVKDAKTQYQEYKKRYDEYTTWKRAESEGRLLVLPCKVGDKVYQTDGIKVYESTVRQLIFDTENIAFDVCAIGKSVFDREMGLGGFNSTSFLSWAKRQDLLKTDPVGSDGKSRNTKKQRINGTSVNTVCIRNRVEDDKENGEQGDFELPF